ncbi:MAG TPA: hypothetical protein VF458_10205 [Ktedonobacteraceae bacterium]
MSGFVSGDGSALVGGKLPNGTGEAFNLDANGNLLVNAGGGGSMGDGALASSIGEESLAVYNSGGPVLASGVPSGLAFDRLRSWLGKGSQTGAIISTSAGDASLSFSAAPKTVLPGQPIKLSGAAQAEYVYVASSYAPSATATSIPLASPVVNNGQTSASWDIFSVAGPGAGSITPAGSIMAVNVILDVATGNLYAQQGYRGVTDVNAGGRASQAIAAGVAANTVVKASPGRLARILVTTSGANALNIFDNSSSPSGTQIALVSAAAAAGTLIDCQAPALNGITVQGNATNPAVTIFYY